MDCVSCDGTQQSPVFIVSSTEKVYHILSVCGKKNCWTSSSNSLCQVFTALYCEIPCSWNEVAMGADPGAISSLLVRYLLTKTSCRFADGSKRKREHRTILRTPAVILTFGCICNWCWSLSIIFGGSFGILILITANITKEGAHHAALMSSSPGK